MLSSPGSSGWERGLPLAPSGHAALVATAQGLSVPPPPFPWPPLPRSAPLHATSRTFRGPPSPRAGPGAPASSAAGLLPPVEFLLMLCELLAASLFFVFRLPHFCLYLSCLAHILTCTDRGEADVLRPAGSWLCTAWAQAQPKKRGWSCSWISKQSRTMASCFTVCLRLYSIRKLFSIFHDSKIIIFLY